MITHVQLFGERCSGTNYVAGLITKNFDDIEMTKAYGGKHWFIKDHYPRCRPNQSTDYQCIRPLSDNADTLFVCLFRNPFDWVRSINARPYHAGDHWGLALSDFLRKPWHSFERIRLNRYWPDRHDSYWFIEEAQNLLRLRSMKIQHLLNLRDRVDNVCYVNYETIRDDNDSLRAIAHRYQIQLKHVTVLGERKHFGRAHEDEYAAPQYAPISEDDLRFILEELDWGVEGRIGYSDRDYLE